MSQTRRQNHGRSNHSPSRTPMTMRPEFVRVSLVALLGLLILALFVLSSCNRRPAPEPQPVQVAPDSRATANEASVPSPQEITILQVEESSKGGALKASGDISAGSMVTSSEKVASGFQQSLPPLGLPSIFSPQAWSLDRLESALDVRASSSRSVPRIAITAWGALLVAAGVMVALLFRAWMVAAALLLAGVLVLLSGVSPWLMVLGVVAVVAGVIYLAWKQSNTKGALKDLVQTIEWSDKHDPQRLGRLVKDLIARRFSNARKARLDHEIDPLKAESQ